ncbi:MAG: hypothetical protein JO325_04830, partial [Solirubrobacterales bacterium]|nr:hypothetical protein [Solirubrobacterales bacterium]
MAHVLVIANETAPSRTLYDVLRERAQQGDVTVTVIAPVNEPRHGYVVYENTRRSSAGRRLTKTLNHLREAGIPSQGFVADTGPVAAVKDALLQLEPKPDEIIVSTHPPQKSGWTRRNVLEDITRTAGDVPVRHVVAADESVTAEKNVLVVANQTLVSSALLDKIRGRAKSGPASFLFVVPQSDGVAQPEAD